MAEGTEVGKAYVSLEATDAGLSSGLKQGEANVEQFAANTTKATGRASKGFAGLGKGIKDTIKPLTTLVGGVTAAVGTFSLFVSLGERIGRTIFGLDAQGRTRQEAASEDLEMLTSQRIGRKFGIDIPDIPRGEMSKEEKDLQEKYKRLDELQKKIAELRRTLPTAEGESNKYMSTLKEEVLRLAQPARPTTVLNDITEYLGIDDRQKNARRNLAAKRGISLGRFELEEDEREASNIRETLRRRSFGLQPVRRALPPNPMSGLGGGDPNAVLRELRAIRQESMRRGSDE